MKVLLAMSGGVDSSLCVYLLQEAGYEVKGVTFDLGIVSRDKFERDVSDAKGVAAQFGIQHEVVDFSKIFKKKVIDSFIISYKNGLTPNPCVICNRVLKFGALLEYAESIDYDYLATGHYANTRLVDGKIRLAKAKDMTKDQTYFMYGVKSFDKVLFPLGNYTKEETRELAGKIGLKTKDKKDSQEICFIDNNYRDFLEKMKVELPAGGNFVDIHGNVLGRHEGIYNYTIGQRKGLNIALGNRAYVTGFDIKKNEVILGTDDMLYKKRVVAKMPETLSEPMFEDKVYEVKTRYKLRGDDCKMSYDKGFIIGDFIGGVRAPAKGQSMVVYDGDIVVAGGEIIDSF